MSGPPDESYFVDADEIEFGEGYDMSKLPPPLPTAEQVAEAWTGGENDDVHPRPAGDPKRDFADGPVFVDLRGREMRDVVWHDRPFLPAGELITNNADGDVGKGLLSVLQATRFSRGEFGDRRMVVFAVAEDNFETVLKPRLVAAEANLANVRCIGSRRKGTEDALRIPDDVPVLEQALSTMNVGLFVIDPLLSHLSAKTNSHIDHEVKLALRPLMQLAHNLGCVVLGNGHFGKDKASGARRASVLRQLAEAGIGQ